MCAASFTLVNGSLGRFRGAAAPPVPVVADGPNCLGVQSRAYSMECLRRWGKTWCAVSAAAVAAVIHSSRRAGCRFAGSSKKSEVNGKVVRYAHQGQDHAEIGFSRDLWGQFLSIAAPYFVPLQPVGRKEVDWAGEGFLPLLGALLLGVVCGTYWFAFIFGNLALAALPAAMLPDGTAGTVASLTSTNSYPIIAGAGLTISAAGFYSARERVADRQMQWALLGLLLFLLFTVTGLNVMLSFVFRTIDNALNAKDSVAYFQQITFFAGVLVIAIPIISGYKFTRLRLGRLWREYLTELFLEKYMARRRFYLLDSNSQATSLDNPDQRISEDIDYFTKETLDFLLDVLDSVLNLFSFAAILFSTSQLLTGALVGYAVIGSLIAVYIGSKLININYEQLRLQADLRYSLVHIRDNAEAIAFYGGEERERREVSGKLRSTLTNYDNLILWSTGMSAYQKAFFYLARLVPSFVLGGLYFSGEVDFGTFGQAQFAFSMVLSSVSLIVSRIQDISRFSAGISRLGFLWEVLTSPLALGPATHPDRLIATDEHTDDSKSNGVLVEGLTLETPDGSRVLIEGLTIALGDTSKQQRLLVVGSSGVGKSSVLRAIAGLWTRGAGRIARPSSKSMLFLPQRPYMPLGDLRTQLLYPSDGTLDLSHSDEELQEVLGTFGLGHLPERFQGGFSAVQDWARVLSLGEQQRLAAARCLISHPRFVVLDEATSALPLPMERSVYQRFQSQRSIEGYISVGHRTSLAEYHDVVLEVQGDGKWQILTPAAYLKAYAVP